MLISPAFAQGAPSGVPGADNPTFLILMVGMFVFLYFFMIRPQMKRAKEAKQMIEALQKGDEVVAAGGVIGKITGIGETYVSIEIAPNVEIAVEKQSVLKPLPKGTIKSAR